MREINNLIKLFKKILSINKIWHYETNNIFLKGLYNEN